MTGRKGASWMVDLDERLLEYLRDHMVGRPCLIASHPLIKAPEGTVQERLRLLSQVELVAPKTGGSNGTEYEITVWGLLYLDGEVDATALRRPHPTAEMHRHPILG